ncbi:hypothetical protein EDI_326250 [Entamoeba dispar SAW760]|uniref:Fungal lipase-type domain-containing protein n=1 Tax=Entamoeba dispar (strain ATCC PRA-260 / SAW760) TaxID=370354 RepID=B0ER50_ENTDS|nr:uncharacterized protein EDI_326250 [Entamoeba dispar SAW760]EDR23003.1 hypothetical protein EDI_326250 [Entamoeba dispar SAW760]|eukprot:EDR23003.1 hypothetical protein EDI_326250 [Entamoeba dispar SAW760]
MINLKEDAKRLILSTICLVKVGSIICKIQLFVFSCVLYIFICLMFLISTVYQVQIWFYAVLMIYNSILLFSWLYNYFVFALDDIGRVIIRFYKWKNKYLSHNNVEYQKPLILDQISFNSWRNKVIKFIYVLTEHISFFGCIIILTIIGGLIYANKHEHTRPENAIGTAYIFGGCGFLLFYFICSIIVDLVIELIKTHKTLGSIPWIELLPLFFPLSFVYSILQKLFQKCSKKFQHFIAIISVILLTGCFILFFIALIFTTADVKMSNGNLLGYWILNIIALIGQLAPIIHYLREKQKNTNEEHIVIKQNSFDNSTSFQPNQCISPHGEYSSEIELVSNKVLKTEDGFCKDETQNNENVQLSFPLEEEVSKDSAVSLFTLLDSLRMRIFGFHWKTSFPLIFFFTLVFMSFTIFGTKSVNSMAKLRPGVLDPVEMNFTKPSPINYSLKQKITTPQEYSHLCTEDTFGITPKEYTLLSYIAYGAPSYVITFLRSRGWIMEMKNVNHWLYYLKAKNQKTNIEVISLRGTHATHEVLHDMQLFLESSVPKMCSTLLPIFTDDTLSWVSYLISYFGSNAFTKGSFNLITMARNLIINEMNVHNYSQLVLSGHSLGAGIAQIVGTELNIEHFLLSPPGMSLVKHNFNMSKERLSVLSRSLFSERDPVSVLGEGTGQQIKIPCYDDPVSCHMPDTTSCMIGALCHDSDMQSFCSKKWEKWAYNPNDWD